MHYLLSIFVSLTVLCLSGCGFTPIYAKGDHNTAEILSSIEVMPIQHTAGQTLYYNLKDLLNPLNKSTHTEYQLSIQLKSEEFPLAIQEDRTATRYRTTLTASFSLVDIASQKAIKHGTIVTTSSYDAVDSEYATYVAKNDTMNRISKEMAQEFKLRLMATLSHKG